MGCNYYVYYISVCYMYYISVYYHFSYYCVYIHLYVHYLYYNFCETLGHPTPFCVLSYYLCVYICTYPPTYILCTIGNCGLSQGGVNYTVHAPCLRVTHLQETPH